MKLDYTLQMVMADVQQEIAEEMDLEVSMQEISNIFRSQINAANYAFTKGVEVRFDKMGVFRRKHTDEIIKGVLELKELKDLLTEEQYKAKELSLKMAKLENNKKRAKNRKTLTLQELTALPYYTNLRTGYNKFNDLEEKSIFIREIDK
jgi:hypothetical protein